MPRQRNLFGASSTELTISEIVADASDPNVRRIRVGRRIVASLRAGDVESLGLKPGMAWNPRVATKVQHVAASLKAHAAAMNMLGRRAYSRGEILDRLKKKGHDSKVLSAVVDELADGGWLNDAAYAEAIVHSATRTKPASKRLLIAKLKARRIDDETAALVIEQATAGTNEFEAALGLARNRLHTMGSLPARTIVRRLSSLLARRGFDEETVTSALDRLKLGWQD